MRWFPLSLLAALPVGGRICLLGVQPCTAYDTRRVRVGIVRGSLLMFLDANTCEWVLPCLVYQG